MNAVGVRRMRKANGLVPKQRCRTDLAMSQGGGDGTFNTPAPVKRRVSVIRDLTTASMGEYGNTGYF